MDPECEARIRGPRPTLTEKELVALGSPSRLKPDKHGFTEAWSEVRGSHPRGLHKHLEQSPPPSREGVETDR